MQPFVNYEAVTAFNKTAPTLESFTIAGRTFECFHDYYHQRSTMVRYGAGHVAPSIMFREPAVQEPYFGGGPKLYTKYCAPYVFRRNSKNHNALAAWMERCAQTYT